MVVHDKNMDHLVAHTPVFAARQVSPAEQLRYQQDAQCARQTANRSVLAESPLISGEQAAIRPDFA